MEGTDWGEKGGDVQPLKVKVLFGIFVSELVRHIDCPFCKPLGSMELGQIWDRFLDRIHTAFNVLPTHQLLSGVFFGNMLTPATYVLCHRFFASEKSQSDT